MLVYNEFEQLDAVFITAPSPKYLSTSVNSDNIGAHLGISDAIDINYSIELIDAGLRTLIVPISNLKNLIEMNPEELILKEFCITNDIDIILVFTLDTAIMDNKARTRVFAPKFGYLEDPATGSGNSAFGYYMIKHNLWNGMPISIEQNAEMKDYNIVMLKTINNKVLFGGGAIKKIDGIYCPNSQK